MKLRFALLFFPVAFVATAQEPPSIAGVYPHLTMYNNEGECGTGAVVPWADRLWVITYGPHLPKGSSDKLYEVSPDLKQIIRPESIGGTPANRMIHRESEQLSIGPYLIDKTGKVRVIPYTKMPGRHTGTARHLVDPKNKIYIATMEEGLYSVDVNDLSVTEHIKDGNGQKAVGNGLKSKLLGYHGKGLYSSQGMLVYANNGEHGNAARTNPTTASGSLGFWKAEGDWSLIRRNQFTEVTGPGGIHGATNDDDPMWAMGWDYRSLILMLLDDGQWTAYRLPKGSHSYDGAHGWNTEWPRIRDIGETELLATMHGTFWRFPKTFSRKNSAGIAPRSNYLKVIGDFTLWGDRLVLGCDDSAQKEFLNHRPFKSTKGAPVQSNSNLWFVDPGILDKLGPAIGRGSVWLRDDVKANQPSDPYLFSGYDHRMMVITHNAGKPVRFTLEVDNKGDNNWTKLETLTVEDTHFHVFAEPAKGAWIRVTTDSDVSEVSVHFHYRNRDTRQRTNDAIFSPFAAPGDEGAGKGLLRSNRRVLSVLADGYYELDDKLQLTAKSGAGVAAVSAAAQPAGVIGVDEASVVVTEDGNTYRLPKNDAYQAAPVRGEERVEQPTSVKAVIGSSIAKGAKVKVGSTHADYAAANAVDGKISDDSRWIAPEGGGKWIEVDLGGAKTFQSVAVVTGWKDDASYAARSIKLEIMTDNEWKKVASVTENREISRVFNLETPVKASKLRVSSADSGYFRVYEVGVFEKHLKVTAPKLGVQVARICREVATERDLFNFHGTFYELPARNAQGFAKIRPIATHNLAIADYASHFGLLFMTGTVRGKTNERTIASTDGKAVVWAGVIDDLWKMGKPSGVGGPWKNTAVQAGKPSDPYLMTGYDRKQVVILADKAANISLEMDIDGTGLWVPYKTFAVQPGKSVNYTFPDGFSAYWVRAKSDADTTASVTFVYE